MVQPHIVSFNGGQVLHSGQWPHQNVLATRPNNFYGGNPEPHNNKSRYCTGKKLLFVLYVCVRGWCEMCVCACFPAATIGAMGKLCL